MEKEEFIARRKAFVRKTLDELVELLASEDLQTRFFAEMCLRDATGV